MLNRRFEFRRDIIKKLFKYQLTAYQEEYSKHLLIFSF